MKKYKNNQILTVVFLFVSALLMVASLSDSAFCDQVPKVDPATTTKNTPNEQGFIQQWLILDPIAARGDTQNAVQATVKAGHFENELTILPKKGDKVNAGGRELTWHSVETDEYNINLYYFAAEIGTNCNNSLFWVVAYINCPEEVKEARLAVGTNSASVWWLNGTEVVGIYGNRCTVIDDGVSKRLTLRKGMNVIRGGIVNASGAADFCARLLDANDKPLTGYTIGLSASEQIVNTEGIPMAQNAEGQGGIMIVPELIKPQNARRLEEKDFGGYVMVYFKDQDQCAYMAVSRDGYTFTDLNNGKAIFDGSRLAEQKGVRDPHMTRGPDGGFYLAMTDLHIFGQRAGYRETQWQRPEERYGWGNNRAIVMMKSFDLIHWTASDFRVDLAFPELGDIDTAWAPETVYDEAADKMMVYFTIRYNNRNANIYWSYTDDAFTKMETIPKMIPDIGGIDGDITKVGDKFHMYYVSNARILHAVSDRINDGYVPEGNRRIDPERVSTEAPNVFKRLGTDTWVLMYDVYGGRPNNMGFSETKDFANYTDIGHFNVGVMKGTNFERPKHGAVTYLTLDELKAVTKHWNVEMALD